MDKIPFYMGFQKDMVPIVYQIEVTNRCNLACPMCFRKDAPQPAKDLSLDDLDRIVENGWLTRTPYVELQMAGEPTLSKDLAAIIDRIKSCGVLVGFSTNLTNNSPDLLLPDSLTISCDSMDPVAYEKSRKPHQFSAFLQNLTNFLCNKNPWQFVQIQMLKTKLTEFSFFEQRSRLKAFLDSAEVSGPRPIVREVQDSFYSGSQPDPSLCLNPFLTVSIRSNGDVVSCCYDFGSENKMGNSVNESFGAMASLFLEKQRSHLDRAGLKGVCSRCCIKSPILFYHSMLCELLKFRHGLGLQ